MTLSRAQRGLVFLILAVCLISIPVTLFVHRPEPDKTAEEKDISGIDSLISVKDRLLVIKLSGMIVDRDTSPLLSKMGTTASVKRELRKALKDKHVKAVLLRINSPGGTVASSQEIHQAVNALKKANKPVVASMGDVAASGGYYVATAADRIFADPGTITGSIGVIMNLFNLQGIEQKLGIQPEVIKSGTFKDMGSFNRAPTAEERKLLQAIILDSYDQFVTAVASGRKKDEQAVRKIADGRIYTGRQAKEIGLIDELGGYDEAVAFAQKLCRERYKLEKDLPVDEGQGWSFLTSLLESASARLSPPGIFDSILPESTSAQFQKQPLWMMQ